MKNIFKKTVFILAAGLIIAGCGESGNNIENEKSELKEETKLVKVDDKIKVQYTGKLKNGEVFDKSKEGQPLEFTVGDGKIIPGLDEAVKGMKLNEEKKVTIDSRDAYGEKKEGLLQDVPMQAFPEDFEPEIGRRLNLQSQDGQTFNGEITSINDESITVDLNHPLAGKDLIFNIKVVGIK